MGMQTFHLAAVLVIGLLDGGSLRPNVSLEKLHSNLDWVQQLQDILDPEALPTDSAAVSNTNQKVMAMATALQKASE